MQHFPGGSFVKLGSAMSLLTGKRMKISYLQAKCPGKGYRRAPDRSLDDKNRFAMVVFQWSYQLL